MNTDDIFNSIVNMTKAQAYDILVSQFNELKSEKVRLELRNERLTKALQKIDAIAFNKDEWADMAKIGEIATSVLCEKTPNIPAANPDDLKDIDF